MLIDELLCFHRGQTLIPKRDDDVRAAPKPCGEALHSLRLLAFFTTHVQRVSHDDEACLLFPDQFGQRFQVGASVLANQGRQAAYRQAKLVRQSDADTALTDVER